MPTYEALKKRCLEERVFEPKVVYGYFPCQSQGNDLVIYQPHTKKEWVRFSFPRQATEPFLCLADYFHSVESGIMDVAPFHLVTVGRKATARSRELPKPPSKKYSSRSQRSAPMILAPAASAAECPWGWSDGYR